MAYPVYNGTKPDPTTDDGNAVCQAVRDNDQVIRDAVVSGNLSGWNMTPRNAADTGAPPDPTQPPMIKFEKSTEEIQMVITWGTTGGADGNPTQIIYKYSSNSGSTFDTIGTQTITYDANGNVTGTTWS